MEAEGGPEMRLPGDELEVNPRDLRVLKAFAGDSSLAFQGLRRKLGLHPESLARSLHRLERDGLVVRDGRGYRLTPRAHSIMAPKSEPPSLQSQIVFEAYLPPDVGVGWLVSQLQGRWFGSLRWLGLGEQEGEVALNWVTDEGDAQVQAKISDESIVVEAIALNPERTQTAAAAAYQLVENIARMLTRSYRLRGVLTAFYAS